MIQGFLGFQVLLESLVILDRKVLEDPKEVQVNQEMTVYLGRGVERGQRATEENKDPQELERKERKVLLVMLVHLG